MPWIVWRYVLRDISVHASLALVAITSLIAAGNVLRFLEDVVGTGIALAALGELLLVILPSFLSYSIPTALIFGILITLGRMVGDGEIVALQSAGFSVARLLPPVLALAGIAAIASAYLVAELGPRSYARMRRLGRELAKTAALIDPGEFRAIGGRVLYFRDRGGEGCPLRGVLVADLSEPDDGFFVNAACGELRGTEGEGQMVFALNEGSIHFDSARGERYRRLNFSGMELPIDTAEQVARRRWPREFTTRELIELEARPQGEEFVRLLWVQVHRRVAFPLASIVLAIVAVPLGLRPLRTGRSAGALTAVVLIGGYWIASSTGEGMAEAGQVPVAAGIWAADVLFLCVGLWLVRRSTASPA